jgi:type II secretory pathway pseudopilin PulG
MRHQRRIEPRRRAGTTVLELVVALVVTGAVAAAGAAAFRTSIDRRTQLVTRASDTERAAAMRALLGEWLSSGTVTWPPRANGLAFTTTAVNPAGAPGLPLRLFIDDDAGTPEQGLTLEFRVSPERPVERREIDADIMAMSVEYLDADTRTWRTADGAAAARPLAVRLTFSATEAGDDRLRRLPLTIVLPHASEPRPAAAAGDTL